MQIGYVRVSTLEQNVDPQIDQLKQAGCERIFRDKASGAKTERPGLLEALDFLREGDMLVVWRLDRLGRSLKHLLETVSMLEERGIGFRSLQESIDTTTSGGRLIFHIFGALAEFERNLIRERTMAGLRAARAQAAVFLLGQWRLLAQSRCFTLLTVPLGAPGGTVPSQRSQRGSRVVL